jgi:hypothetical protein
MPRGCKWVSLGEAVENVMSELQDKMAGQMEPTLEYLTRAAELIGDIDQKELLGKGSHREATVYRQIIMWLAVRRVGISASSVGRFLDRDHSTVIYGVRCVQKRVYANSTETIGMVEDVWEAAQKLARGEGVKRKVKAEAAVPLKANKPPPERAPEPLRHWKHYEVCSENWWAANHAEFVKGMLKARAGVFQEAGE